VHHLADRLSDQRRRVPQPQGRHSAGPHRQRGAAGADALLDDLPDDHRRHHLQGAAAGDPGPRHRRSSRRSGGAELHGFNPKTSEFFIGTFGPLGGGWGAKKTEDGVSATVCLNDGDTHNGPNEQAEAKFPIVVERFELIPDSAGAGRHRGGLGIARTVRALSNMVVNSQSDRSKCPPWGLDGGGDATGNRIAFRLGDQWKDDFANAKVLVAQLKAEDAFRISSGGGGGYGEAFERPVEDVREDVRQGYVSVKAAAERYGVGGRCRDLCASIRRATDRLRAAKH
jgi:N-methylhydantoinase B